MLLGKLNLMGLLKLLMELECKLGDNEHANNLIELFKNAYLNHVTLADATRYLVNELFGEYGIVILRW